MGTRLLRPYFIMTVDVDPPIPSNPNSDIVRDGVAALLELFDRHAIKATFFVPAVVAEKFPIVIREVVKQGHEVACHGLEHNKGEASLGVDEEIQIIRTATKMIQSVINVRPVGFRAPVFNVNESCWVALQKNGYIYDSSIVCSPFYKNFFPSKPFLIQFPKTNKDRSLLEIPVSVNPLLPLPLGGAYMRNFGLKWCKVGIKINFLLQNPVVFYVHPKDVDPRTRGRSWWWYRNTSNCMELLEKIIKYAKQNRAQFLKMYEFAKLFQSNFTQ